MEAGDVGARVGDAILAIIMRTISRLAWAAIPGVAVCAALSQVAAQGSGSSGANVPVGAVQAFEVDVRYTIDAGQAARDAGGDVFLVQKVPPSMRAGTSPNQDITTSFTLDGQQPEIKKSERGDDLYVLKATSKSGTAVFTIKGIVYNRDLTRPSGQKVPLSEADRRRYIADSRYIKPSDPKVQSAIDALGLRKKPGETDRAFADRLGVWIARNKKYRFDGNPPRDADNPQVVLQVPEVNCNGASALWATVLQANGIPTQIRLRLIIRTDNNPEKWTFHADVMPYLDGEWVGINSTVPMSDSSKILQGNTMIGARGFFADISPGYGGPLIDIATIAEDRIKLDDIRALYATFNSHLPYRFSQHAPSAKCAITVTHSVREVSIRRG